MSIFRIFESFKGNNVVNIEFITFWRKSFLTILTSKIISLFGFFPLYFPRPSIMNLMPTTPPRASCAFNIFRTPQSITSARTKCSHLISFYKLITLTIKHFTTISAFYFSPRMCLFITYNTTISTRFYFSYIRQNVKKFSTLLTLFFDSIFELFAGSINALMLIKTQTTTKATGFYSGDTSINVKNFPTLLTNFLNFWLMFHNHKYNTVLDYIKNNSSWGRFSWRKMQ